jgi:HD-like signal output (HDOD) protein
LGDQVSGQLGLVSPRARSRATWFGQDRRDTGATLQTAYDRANPLRPKPIEAVRLPVLPVGLGVVMQAAEQPDTSLSTLAKLVEAEPSLTLHVLKLSNSAAYGVGRPVRSVAQATILLGGRAVRNMAVTQLMQVMVARVDSGLFDVDSFWEHSLRRAGAAFALAELAGYEETSEAFSTGLIQDLGLLIFAVSQRDKALEVTGLMSCPAEVRRARELELFGETHSQVLGRAARLWGVPIDIVDAIEGHDGIGDKELSRRVARLAELLKVGDLVADTMVLAPTFQRLATLQEALAALRTRAPIDTDLLFSRVATVMREMAAALSVRVGEPPSWEQLMAAAQKLLERVTAEYEERTRRLEAELRERDQQLITRRQRRAERGLLPIDRAELVRRLGRMMDGARVDSAAISLVLFLVQAPQAPGEGGADGLEPAVAATRERLVAAVREEDVVFRLGRDELVAILPGCSRSDGPTVASRLCAKLTREFLTVEGRAPTRLSILCTGTSLEKGETVGADELLRRAEVIRFQAHSERLDIVSWWG